MKEEMSSADVSAVIHEFNILIDAKIGKIYQTASDEIRINLFIFGKGKDNLIIESRKRIHLSKHLKPSPTTPQSFPMLLRKHIYGGRITFIKQHDFDRIIEFGIIRGGIETILVIELFSKGNIILLNNERKIILPLHPVSYKGRKIRSGEEYQYPDTQINPVNADKEQLKTVLISSDADIVRTIASRFNLGGVLAEEVCHRSGIDKRKSSKEVDDYDIQSLKNALDSIFYPLSKGEFKPCIIKKQINGNLEPFDVAPIELKIYKDFDLEYFESFNLALDEFFGKKSLEIVVEKKEIVKKEKIGVLERRLNQQQSAIEKFTKDAEKNNLIAESIYADYKKCDDMLKVLIEARKKHSWKEIKKILKGSKYSELISNINEKESIFTMSFEVVNAAIDIRKTVPQNAQVYYDKAKKLLKKRDGAMRAIEITKQLIQKKEKKKELKALDRYKKKIGWKKRWYDRFRWFVSSDGFFVVGGRDADTNEEIVKKYMEKRDIVFHAQMPGAPITVIKTEGKSVPDTTLKEASQFAISYSNVWKAGQFEGDCYQINPDQISKTPESGEYLKKGSFVIRGERKYYKNIGVGVAIGIEMDKEVRVIGGPISAIKRNGKHVVELIPGKFNQNDIAKKIYKIYLNELKDIHFVKQVASPDLIARMLPPGTTDVKI